MCGKSSLNFKKTESINYNNTFLLFHLFFLFKFHMEYFMCQQILWFYLQTVWIFEFLFWKVEVKSLLV